MNQTERDARDEVMRTLFPHQRNADLAEYFGVSEWVIEDTAQRLKLRKADAYLAVQRAAAATAYMRRLAERRAERIAVVVTDGKVTAPTFCRYSVDPENVPAWFAAVPPGCDPATGREWGR